MSTIRVVTDSSSDLMESGFTSTDFDIQVVPLSIRFGDEEFTDGLDLTAEEFYHRMARTDELPQDRLPVARCLRAGVPSERRRPARMRSSA